MKKIELSFILVFVCFISLPILGFRPNESVSQEENRNLSSKPTPFKEGKLNGHFFSDTGDYLQDHFGGRSHFIKLSNFLEKGLLHKRNFNEKAVEGKDGWYFYINKIDGANLADFQKKNLLKPYQQEAFKNRVSEVTQWCDSNGIKYLFVIGPNKHNVYPEKYPLTRPEGITKISQIEDIFKSLNVPYVYSLERLLEKKNEYDVPLYYETDTHWNALGAYTSFEEILEKLQPMFGNALPKIEYEQNVEYSDTFGDILPMLGIKGERSTQIKMTPKNGQESDYFEYIKNDGMNGILTTGKDQNLPKAVIFRDSFCIALVKFISPLFSSTEYNWRHFGESDKEKLLKNKPDIIIFESVERHAELILSGE